MFQLLDHALISMHSMACTTWGPVSTSRGEWTTLLSNVLTSPSIQLIGPIASGFVATVSWRWTYWVGLIVAGATWPLLLMMPETYGPIILQKEAQRLRKQTGNPNIVAPVELVKTDLRELIVVVLARPIRMFLFEAIVLTTCLYLSVAYAIFYSESLICHSGPIVAADNLDTSILPGVSNHIPGHIWLQRRRRRPGFPTDWCRRGHCRLYIPCVGLVPG